jgi:hypothetical protein
MKKELLVILMIFYYSILNAQLPTYQWAKKAGGTVSDVGYSIAVDDTGNVITTGYFKGTSDFDPGTGTANLVSAGGEDFFIQKLDGMGSFLWAKRFGNANPDFAYSVTVDDSGYVYATGQFNGTVDFDPGSGVFNLVSSSSSYDIFIVKLHSNGNFAWAKKLGGVNGEVGYSIFADSYSNVYFTGEYNGGIIVAKYNYAGATVWFKTTLASTSRSLAVDSIGNVFITGNFSGTVDFDPGVGTSNLSSSSGNVFIQKLDPMGNYVWARNIGGSGLGYSLAVGNSGSIYLTGTFTGTFDADNGTGTYNLVSAGYTDVFVEKLDSLGNFQWACKIGGTGNDHGNAIAIDNMENVYVIGNFISSVNVDFDPGTGVFNLISGSNTAIFLQKLTSSGNFVWAFQMGNGSAFTYNEGQSIKLDLFNNIYTTGSFTTTVDFNPGTATNNLSSVGGYDIFIQKLAQSTTTEIENITTVDENDLVIYPNPTHSIFNMDVKNNRDGVIEIFNILGQKIYSRTIMKDFEQLNIEDNAIKPGIYLIVLTTGKNIYCRKAIKQ